MNERTIKSPALKASNYNFWCPVFGRGWACTETLGEYFNLNGLGVSIRLVLSSVPNPSAYQLVPVMRSAEVCYVDIYQMKARVEVSGILYHAALKVSKVKGFCWLSVEEA